MIFDYCTPPAKLTRHERQELALRLLMRHAHIAIVQAESRLDRRTIRTLKRILPARPAGPSKLKRNAASVCRSPALQREAALLARIHRATGSDDRHWIWEAMAVYDRFEALHPHHRITFSDWWIVLRDLQRGETALKACPHCGAAYLDVPPPRLACPACGRHLGRRPIRWRRPRATAPAAFPVLYEVHLPAAPPLSADVAA